MECKVIGNDACGHRKSEKVNTYMNTIKVGVWGAGRRKSRREGGYKRRIDGFGRL